MSHLQTLILKYFLAHSDKFLLLRLQLNLHSFDHFLEHLNLNVPILDFLLCFYCHLFVLYLEDSDLLNHMPVFLLKKSILNF